MLEVQLGRERALDSTQSGAAGAGAPRPGRRGRAAVTELRQSLPEGSGGPNWRSRSPRERLAEKRATRSRR